MIDGAKLSTFQATDAPVAPGSKNLANFLDGVTYEMRQERRDRLFACTKDDVMRVADKYLGKHAAGSSAAAVIGPKNDETEKLKWPVVSA